MVGVDEPVDLAAVQADDELINALAAGMFVNLPGLDEHHNYDDGDRVVAMLAAWKAGIDAEPLPPLLDATTTGALLDAAATTTGAVSRAVGNPGRRYLVPLAGAAALVVFALAGVSVGARSAQPGDTLWAVSKVLYSEHAHSVEAAAGAASRLEKVRTALASGQTELAARELAATAPLLAAVAPEDGGSQLVQQQQFLTATLAETPPNTATDPNAPLLDAHAAPAVTPAGRTPAGSPDGSSALGSPAPGSSLSGSSLSGSSMGRGTKPGPPPAADPPVLGAPLPPPVPIPARSPVPDPVLVLPVPVLPVLPDPQTTSASPRPTTEGTPPSTTPHPTSVAGPGPAGNTTEQPRPPSTGQTASSGMRQTAR